MEPGKSVSSFDLEGEEEPESSDESSDDSSSDESADVDSHDSDDSDDADAENKENQEPAQINSTNDLKVLHHDDVSIGQWVKVKYEDEVFLGKVLKKTCGECLVQCLEKPFGVNDAQSMESEANAVFYECVYESNVMPRWQKVGRGWKYVY